MPILRKELIDELAIGLDGGWIGKYDPENEGMSLSLPNHRRNATIGISYNFFSTAPAGYILGSSLIGHMAFEEVESIVSKYFKKYNIPLALNTCWKVSIHIPEMDGANNEYRISNPGDTIKVIDKIQIMVDDLMPFFERFQTLEEVYEHLEYLPVDQMSGFVNNPMPVRRMIMKKLLDTPDFEAYGKRIVRNVNAKSSQPPYRDIAKYIGEMYDDLKSM